MLLYEPIGDAVYLMDYLQTNLSLSVVQIQVFEAASGTYPALVSFFAKEDVDGEHLDEIECAIDADSVDQYYKYKDYIEQIFRSKLEYLAVKLQNPDIENIPISFVLEEN